MTNRREFLTGIGLLAATASLPKPACAGEAAGADTFAQRGRTERLSLAYAHIACGATKPFSVLHISDTHLTAAYPDEPDYKRAMSGFRTKTFGGRQEEALADSLAWARENADYVLHTGDLVDWVSRANLDLVKKHFGDIALATVGNHEYVDSLALDREKGTKDDAWRQRTAPLLKTAFPFDLSFASQVVNGVNFVMLDNVYGTVSKRQVELFEAEVGKALPIVLCAHVPFVTDFLWRAHEKYWTKGRLTTAVPPIGGILRAQREDAVTRDFVRDLRGEPLLKGILAGHFHFTAQDRFSPTVTEYVVGGNYLFQGEEILFS